MKRIQQTAMQSRQRTLTSDNLERVVKFKGFADCAFVQTALVGEDGVASLVASHIGVGVWCFGRTKK